MQYYRSVTSSTAPEEVIAAFAAAKASKDRSQNAILLEDWMSSDKNWRKSRLVFNPRRSKGTEARMAFDWMNREAILELHKKHPLLAESLIKDKRSGKKGVS